MICDVLNTHEGALLIVISDCISPRNDEYVASEEMAPPTAMRPNFLINRTHPTHFKSKLGESGGFLGRLRGLRTNASYMCHEELDNAEVLDIGNPAQIGRQHAALLDRNTHINILGGWCGNAHRRIEEISKASREQFKSAA